MTLLKPEPVSERRTKTSRGRHPLLKDGSMRHRIFVQLKLSPDPMTAEQIAHNIMASLGSVRRQLAVMLREGLVYPVNVMLEGRLQPTAFEPNIQAETGYRRDTVEIESVIFVNDAGEYSVRSRIVGGLPTMHGDNPQPIQVIRHRATVLKPEELTVKIERADDCKRYKKYDTVVIEH